MTLGRHLLIDEVLIVRPAHAVDDEDAPLVDDWNQPVAADPLEVAVVPASIQPRSVEELAAQHEGGPVVSEYVIFINNADVRESDYLIGPDGVYQIMAKRDPAGRHRYLALDAERVAA
jgi:hypothetical protein